MLKFVIPGRPTPKSRPQFNRYTGKARTPQATKEYERYVALCGRMAMSAQGQVELLGGAIGLRLTFLFGRPKRIARTHHLYEQSGRAPLWQGGGYPDLSNLVKAVEDGLQGIVYDDDCQVCYLESSKAYCAEDEDKPGVEVEVWRIE